MRLADLPAASQRKMQRMIVLDRVTARNELAASRLIG
jgi:hypothetical protein